MDSKKRKEVPPLLVLAGGFGTRLRSAVADVPKSLAPVQGIPFLALILKLWIQQGVHSFVFLLHHQADLIRAFLESELGRQILEGCNVRCIEEPSPLGTGGAVAHAVSSLGIKGRFLVSNSDTWLKTGIQRLIEIEAPAICTVKVDNTERYGSVVSEGARVTGFCEKQRASGYGEINAGLYMLESSIFENLHTQRFSLESEVFPNLAREGKLKAVRLDTDFIDIGIPDDYHKFCNWITGCNDA